MKSMTEIKNDAIKARNSGDLALDARFMEGMRLQQQKRLADAERIYQQILQREPRHFPALHLLGVIACQTGRTAQGVELIGKAIALNAKVAAAHNDLGNALLDLNRPEEALGSYERAIALNPEVALAHNNRGNVLLGLKRPEEALASYNKAIALKPDFAEAYTSRGVALRDLKRLEEALASYDKAIALKSDLAETYSNRGNALMDLKRSEEALASYNKAVALSPNVALAHSNRGNALLDLKRPEEALATYDKALQLQFDLAEARLGRGNALCALKRHDEAIAVYDETLVLMPSLAIAWLGRGNACHELKRNNEALAAYDKALTLEPDFAEAWLGRAGILCDLKCSDDALAAYDKALTLKADLAEAWLGRGNVSFDRKRYDDAIYDYDTALAYNSDLAEAWLGHGNILANLKNHDEALAAYDKALALRPDLAEAWLGRGNVFFSLNRYNEALAAYTNVLTLKPDLEGAEGALLNLKMRLCDWTTFDAECDHLISSIRKGKADTDPFVILAIPTSADEQLKCARSWVSEKYPQGQRPVWKGESYKHDKIRVAYVSADFHQHATTSLMAGLFECHDKSQFEIAALSIGPDDKSEMRERLKRSFDHFIECGSLNDDEIVSYIKERETDLLIDLKGFTKDARTALFARRPAPTQVNYLGYPGTMGANYIDYLIADRTIIPDMSRKFYAEKIVVLPNTYQVNDRMRAISSTAFNRTDERLPPEGFVFCCFNNSYKIIPCVFDRWMRILAQVQGSVLWLLEDNASAVMNLKKEAVARGVSSERLVFAKRIPSPDHLARCRLADLFLDTLPYNAHTTASDALWAGLPVLTCIGETFAGRAAASLLKSIKLPELITTTLEEYQLVAVDLATHPEKLSIIKRKLADNRLTAPLFDTQLFTKHIEAAYMAMYERHQAGLAPDHLVIAN